MREIQLKTKFNKNGKAKQKSTIITIVAVMGIMTVLGKTINSQSNVVAWSISEGVCGRGTCDTPPTTGVRDVNKLSQQRFVFVRPSYLTHLINTI